MKKSSFVLFFDSGLGGISTLFCSKHLLKTENFLYFADFLNAPFGLKSKKALLSIIEKNLIDCFKNYNIKAVVLACNTATSVAIKSLRAKFNVPFVGAEPALLPALRENYKTILVLCTLATKKHNKLLKEHSKSNNIKFCCPSKLSSLIDINFANLDNIMPYLKRVLGKFRGKVDGIVLGCTHYVFIKPQLKKIFGEIKFFDGNKGVAKRLQKLLKSPSKKGKIVLISSDKTKQNFLEQSFVAAQKLLKEDLCAD